MGGPEGEREDRGAVALEFALVSLVLFPLLFGLVDYGVYFADVISVQRSAGVAARAASLPTEPPAPGDAVACPAGADPLQRAACSAAGQVDTLRGGVAVQARLVAPDGTPSTAWTGGSTLRLCVLADHPAVLPVTPLPAGGRITVRVDMPVQPQPPAELVAAVSTSPGAPAHDWSWCDR